MKELPCLEEIYDYETDQLERILNEINQCLLSEGQIELPKGFESYEKFERKALKLKESLELELEERKQVDDVINFFINKNDFLDDNDDQSQSSTQNDSIKPTFSSSQNDTQRDSEIQSQRETQSVMSQQEDEEGGSLSKQMFANRANMIRNKKDLQQFMKEKLQKTKVSQSSISSVSAMGPQQKNFVKQKQSTSSIKQEESVITQKRQDTTPTATTKQNIYKPNLKKVTPSSEKANKRQSIEKIVTDKQQKQQSVERNVNDKQKETKKVIEKVAKQSKKVNYASKPPMIRSITQSLTKKDKANDADIKTQEILNQEEIQSKYYDHEEEEKQQVINDIDIDIDIGNENIVIQTKNEEEKVQQKANDYKQEINQIASIDNSKEYQEGKQQVKEVELQEERTQQIEKGIRQTEQQLNDQDNEDEEDGGEEQAEEDQEDDEFYKPIDQIEENNLIQNQVQDKSKGNTETKSNIDDETVEQQQEEQQIINVHKESASSPVVSSDEQKVIDYKETDKHDTDVKVNKRQESKAIELIKKITTQDEAKKKEEQEQRLKQIRDDMQKSKQQQQIDSSTGQSQHQQVTKDKQESTNQQIAVANGSKQTTQQKETKKKVIKKQQQPASSIPRVQLDSEALVDYSQRYKSFYDIFVGQVLDPKSFDISFVMRDTRNMYATFISIMDINALKNKYQFEQAPIEKSMQDYYQANHFMLMGKSINDLELDIKNRDTDIMLQAMNQVQLRDRFQQLKQKDLNDIVKEATQQSQKESSLIDLNKDSSLYFRVVKNRTEVYDIITRAFSRKKRWNELPHGLDLRNSWNLLWTWSKIKIDLTKLICWQRCNHFNGAKNVSRKDFLKRNIERAQNMSQKAKQVFNIMPLTFILPKEYVQFLETFSEYEDVEGKMNFWIMKPAAKSRGRGIQLVNDISTIVYGEPIVIQRYIKNPLLIDGYKFDLRIYVLVTSVNPLEVFLYKDGFARFSTMPFSLDPTDKGNKYIHLTNVSIQKYNVNNSDQNPTDLMYGGTKISLQTLKQRMPKDVNWDEQIWPQVKEVIVKSLIACQNDIQYNPCCFELFGYDIMIDQDYKCWLIEINSSPSLARETLLDDMVKQRLIDDSIDLVDPIDFDRKRLFEVLERRINDDFKQNTSANAFAKKTMNRDLTYILNGQIPRKYGEMPKIMGNYERIAPSSLSEQYLKLIGGQKMFGSMMKVSQQQTQ